MGFYSPAVLVDDAKRHGLRVKAIDVQVSRWPCTIEAEADGSLSMRMGLGYAKGLRKESAEAIVAAREEGGKFRSAEDLALRVPSLNRKELTILACVGALNSIDGVAHRRDALWQVERAGKLEGPLFRQRSEWLEEDAQSQPLQQMNVEERLVADYGGTGVTLHSNRGLTALIYQHCPRFYRTVTVLKSRTFVFKSRTKLSRKFVRDLNAKSISMGDRERGGLGRSTAQGSCDPSLGRALQTQRGERRQGGRSTRIESNYSL
jgi:DNA polymerase III alpha subunit